MTGSNGNENFRGQVAHGPHTIVTPYQGGDPSDVFSNPLYAPPRGYDKHYPGQVSSFYGYVQWNVVYCSLHKSTTLYCKKCSEICAEI